MTAGELRKKIKNLPADTPIYLVTDKESDGAWDEDRCRWRYAHPLAYAALIDRISGKGTWESNPYVFTYEFELVD